MVHLKNTEQIEKLRASAAVVGRTLAEVAAHIKPGVTTGELDAVAEKCVLQHNAKPAFKGYTVGRRVFPATLCTSVNAEVVHGIPGDYVLQEGDLVSVDCGVVLNGYYGDSAFTFGVGTLSPESIRLCQVTYDALHRGIDKAIAGNRIGDISSAIGDYCDELGFGVVRDLVGHGIGRNLHEDPQVPNFGRRGTGRKLKQGMTMCLEPMINTGTFEVVTASDGWTVVAADGLPSAHYEHMVVVQRGQAEILSSFAAIEEVIEPPYKMQLTDS